MKDYLHWMAFFLLLPIAVVCMTTAVGHMRAMMEAGDERHGLPFLKYGALAAVAFVGATLNLASVLGWQ